MIFGFLRANSQLLSVFETDTSNFPIIKSKFYAFDKDDKKLNNISSSDFELLEDGLPRKVINVSCPPYEEPRALSSVLTIDVSSSMSGEGLSRAKSAATAWINGLPLGKSECAITSFGSDSYLVQDFTTDRNKLIQSLNSLIADGGTDYDKAYWETIISGLEIAKRGINNRILVFLSDGEPNINPQTQKIIDLANQYQVTIYCITLNMASPQCLKDISTKTGGLWFENITTEFEAKSIYLKILNIAENKTPCTIEWESNAVCPKNSVTVDVTLNTINANAKISYILPAKGKAYLELNPTNIIIWNIPTGKTKDTTMVIKAMNADFNISNITSSNPNFSISPTSFSLMANESKTLTINYTPTDSLINFCAFDIINDKCKTSVFARAGFYGHISKNSPFKVIHPNGGERFGIGTDTVITWEGCSPEENVILDYSIDSGNTYNQISRNASGLKYDWKNIPNTPSNQCLIKATLGNYEDTNSVKILGFGDLKQAIFSPDGSKIASCGYGGIFIWDPAAGEPILSIRENTGYVYCIAFSPDGSIIAGGCETEIKLWDANTGEFLKSLKGHFDLITGLSFSHDGSKLVSGSNDYNIKLWDVNTGDEIRTLTGHTNWIKSVSFSPDGSKIASGSVDQTVKLWDADTGAEIRNLIGHTGEVNSVGFSPDGSKIVSGSGDNSIKIWEVKTGLEIRTLTGHTDKVKCVSFSSDGNKIASGCGDNTIKLWDVNSGLEIRILTGHYNIVNSVSFSIDGNTLVSGSDDNNIKLWDINTGNEIKTLTGHMSTVFSISLSSDGSTIASGTLDKSINLWDFETFELIRTLSGHTQGISSVCFSPDFDILASGSGDSTVKVWDTNNGTEISTLIGHTAKVNSVCFSPDGSIIASGSDDNTIKLWEVNKFTETATLNGHNGRIKCISFSPDGSKLASANEYSITLWDVNTGTKIFDISDYSQYKYFVCFSPDGTKLASGNGTNIIIRDVNSGTVLNSLHEHVSTGNFISACFSPDGNKIASGCGDFTIKLWDIKSSNIIRTLTGHKGPVNSIIFSQDGSTIASGSADCSIRFWNLGKGSSIVDVSDSVWAIISPKSVTKDIDMGMVLVGSVKDSVVQSFVVNLSDVKSRIDSIRIIGNDEDQFALVSGMPPYILDANQSQNVEFKFSPTTSGVKTAKIHVYTALDSVITNIRGEGVTPPISIENKLIDFGKVTVGRFKDTIAVATIKNIGSSQLNITKTQHNKPNDVDFTTLSGGSSFSLSPGETHEMNLRFTARDAGLTNGSLDFEYNGVGSPAKISLLGEGISYGVASAELKADSLEGYPGDIIEVSIILNNQKNILLSGAASFKTDLSYNSTLLLPIEYESEKIDETTSKITIDNLPIYKNIGEPLTKVSFIAGLGNAEGCSLALSNAMAIGGTVDISLLNGNFKLLGICPEGGNRLINPDGKEVSLKISPNPSDGKLSVELNLIEDGNTTLRIYNNIGNIVFEKNIESITGKLDISIETSNLSNGLYYMSLQTPTVRKVIELIIFK
jgi:WD40 repeat protein/uncharacterized protein YegL